MLPLAKRPDCRSRCSATGPNSENSEPHDMRLSALLPCAQARASQHSSASGSQSPFSRQAQIHHMCAKPVEERLQLRMHPSCDLTT